MHLLTIIIPTFNRADQVTKTIRSINDSLTPDGCAPLVLLVDNNSNPEESAKYKALADSASNGVEVQYVCEKKQGRSHACNLGLHLSTSDWVAYIDDDETLGEKWIETALHWIQKDEFDYVGGPYLPNWKHIPPKWLPAHTGAYKGVLGWIEASDQLVNYAQTDAELCGGNFIARRALLNLAGGFNTKLGRTPGTLIGGEDGELHQRIKRVGGKGIYDPKMAIHHLIPASRMTLNYHLRWAYWSGVTNRIRIEGHPETGEQVPHMLGVPRYWYAKALNGVMKFLGSAIRLRLFKNPEAALGMMDFMYWLGLMRGKLEAKKIATKSRG